MYLTPWLNLVTGRNLRNNCDRRRRTHQALLELAAELLEDRTLLSAVSSEPAPLDPLELAADGSVIQLTSEGSISQTVSLTKVETGLASLYAEYQQFSSDVGVEVFTTANPFLQVDGGMVAIDAVSASGAGGLLADLQAIGLEGASVYSTTISGWLPIDALDELDGLDRLKFASAAYRPWANVGDVTSQGDVALNADDARSIFGVDGSGVTIGVLSDSFDTGPGSYAADIDSGDLPAGITVLEDSPDGTDEGRAMLQLIHDVAPGADLAFHTALTGQAGFASGILDLANVAGADVIVDDVIYFAEPMFQDGIIAQAVDTVEGMGVSYFSSAGNADRASYESAFVASGETLTVNGQPRGELHDFDPDPGVVDVFQSITVPFASGFIMSFQWADPYFSVSGGSGAAHDLDIYVVDALGGQVLAESVTRNIGGDPIEVLQFTNTIFPDPFDPNTGKFNIMISTFDGPDAVSALKYVRFDMGAGIVLNEFDTASGSTFGHSNAAGAVAVGAAFYGDTPEFGQSPPLLESYSSAGGTPVLFDTLGNVLPAPDIRQSPDIVAPDGTDTTFFGTDTDANGFPNFFGTSAAAPHAAAVAALMLQANPTLTADDVLTILTSTAVDMDAAGFDFDTGYGLIQADLALAAVPPAPRLSLSLTEATITEPDGTTTATITRWGADTSTALLVVLASSDDSEATVPATVTIPAGLPSAQFAVTAADDDLADGLQTVEISASAPGFFPASRQLSVADDEPNLISQWAATLIEFSSQWLGDPFGSDWTAMQTLGEPDTFQYGDLPTAWAAETPDGTGEEYLTLGYERAVFATGATIRETWNNGFVKKVEVRNADTGVFETVSTAPDPSQPGTPVDYTVAWPITAFPVDAVRVTVDSNHVSGDWEEIDAVQLHGWTQPPLSTDVFAESEITIDGTAQGGLANTFTSDDVYESITEEGYAGNQRSRLEHEWSFNVPASANTTFQLEAYHDSSVEDFRFEYSLDDGASWTAMLTVTSTSDDDQLQEFAFSQPISGHVLVRVQDTDRSRNESTRDTIFVDRMFFRCTSGDGTTTPEVSVAATDATAAEPGSDTGEFTITRTGNLNDELTVFYTLTGTASGGADYVTLPQSVVIPIDSATAVITVTPLDDSDAEGPETVVLTLATDPAYLLASANSATVTILDDEITFSDDFATGETQVSGSVGGSLANTLVSDDVYESIREEHSRGKPNTRISFLEHRWGFNVTGGGTVTLFIEAFHDSSEEDFAVEISTDDGGSWSQLGTVTKTADNDTPQTFALPAATSGPVLVRVIDTDRFTAGFGQTDTIFVDQIFIRSAAAGTSTPDLSLFSTRSTQPDAAGEIADYADSGPVTRASEASRIASAVRVLQSDLRAGSPLLVLSAPTVIDPLAPKSGEREIPLEGASVPQGQTPQSQGHAESVSLDATELAAITVDSVFANNLAELLSI